MREEVIRVLGLELKMTKEEMQSKKADVMVNELFDTALETFKRRMDRMATVAYPVIKQVYENQGKMYQNILIPVTDGKRMYNITCNLEAAYNSECKDIVKSFEKSILLHTIDELWKEHLRELDELRNSVQNASYEQKDPLLIYKLESFGLFKKMINSMNKKAASVLMRGQIPVREAEEVQQAAPEKKEDFSKYKTSKEETEQPKRQLAPGQRPPLPGEHQEINHEPVRVEKRVGRNEPCPCGSGKKFKNCHGKEE